MPPASCCLVLQRAPCHPGREWGWLWAPRGQGELRGCKQQALPWDAAGEPRRSWAGAGPQLEAGRGRDGHSPAQGEAPGYQKVTGPSTCTTSTFSYSSHPAPAASPALQSGWSERNWLAALPDWDWHHVPALPRMPRPAGTGRSRIQMHSPGSHNSCPRHSPSALPQMPYANFIFKKIT